MGAKLSASNPYLLDAVIRERMLFNSVASSSAIEGIHAPFKQMALDVGKHELVSSSRKVPVSKARSNRAKP
ncbi:MAG TPA: hypothetical protein VHE58_07540 [Burkholderiales bacterium]|nr:hypothetical protein [Burkholderiales bacterium]